MSTRPPATRIRFWRYAQALTAPVLLWALVAFFLREPVNNWLEGDDSYDRSALEEWLDESRGFRETLPEMAAGYAQHAETARRPEVAGPIAGPMGAGDGGRRRQARGDS
jgi:hypothetical protein